jgi:hypothetical protein
MLLIGTPPWSYKGTRIPGGNPPRDPQEFTDWERLERR